MATIEVPERILMQLKANANARHLPLDAYLEAVASEDATKSTRQLAAIESIAKGMAQWTERHLPPNHAVDDSRESIYPDRD